MLNRGSHSKSYSTPGNAKSAVLPDEIPKKPSALIDKIYVGMFIFVTLIALVLFLGAFLGGWFESKK